MAASKVSTPGMKLAKRTYIFSTASREMAKAENSAHKGRRVEMLKVATAECVC